MRVLFYYHKLSTVLWNVKSVVSEKKDYGPKSIEKENYVKLMGIINEFFWNQFLMISVWLETTYNISQCTMFTRPHWMCIIITRFPQVFSNCNFVFCFKSTDRIYWKRNTNEVWWEQCIYIRVLCTMNSLIDFFSAP